MEFPMARETETEWHSFSIRFPADLVEELDALTARPSAGGERVTRATLVRDACRHLVRNRKADAA